MSIGEKLKNLRLRTGRTLEEQSEILGVSLTSIYRWEHDLAVPLQAVLIKISVVYNVPIGWLLNGSAHTRPKS